MQREVTEARLVKELGWSLDELDAAQPHRLRRYISVWNEDTDFQQEQQERAGAR